MITDFSALDDRIQLDQTEFTVLATGALATAAFWSGAGVTTAHDASDRIIYNTTTGNLYYDADGTGTGASAIKFADLENLACITAGDFFIVT